MSMTQADPSPSPARTTGHAYRLGTFSSHREAEQVVERLSDVGFPAGRARLVAIGPGHADPTWRRLTRRRVVAVGAGLGAWLGFLAGLALAIFVAGAQWLTILSGGLAIGAAAGAVLAFAAHWATGKHPDFSGAAGRSQRYAVEVDRAHAVEAVQALHRS
jgi:hypothetical protein